MYGFDNDRFLNVMNGAVGNIDKINKIADSGVWHLDSRKLSINVDISSKNLSNPIVIFVVCVVLSSKNMLQYGLNWL